MYRIIIFVLLIPRVFCFNELMNRTNIIDRRSVSPSYSKDQILEDGLGGGCGSCAKRQDIRNRSLENIKEQILFRLGMQEPLNTTGRRLPQVPQDMLAQLAGIMPGFNGMLGDQPQSPFTPGPSVSEEEDTLHIKTESVYAFAKPCKFENLLFIYLLYSESNCYFSEFYNNICYYIFNIN